MWDFSKAKNFQLHKLYFFRILAHITEAIFLALQQWKQGLRLLNEVLHLAMSSANWFPIFGSANPTDKLAMFFFIFSQLLMIFESSAAPLACFTLKNPLKIAKNTEKMKNTHYALLNRQLLLRPEIDQPITSLFALQSFAKCRMTFFNRPQNYNIYFYV